MTIKLVRWRALWQPNRVEWSKHCAQKSFVRMCIKCVLSDWLTYNLFECAVEANRWNLGHHTLPTHC